jgi:hypothetical protein
MNVLYMLVGKAESQSRPRVEVMREHVAAGSPEPGTVHPFWAGVVEAEFSVERHRTLQQAVNELAAVHPEKASPVDSIDPDAAIRQFYEDQRQIDELCDAIREVDAGTRTWDSLVSAGLVCTDKTEAEVRRALRPFMK